MQGFAPDVTRAHERQDEVMRDESNRGRGSVPRESAPDEHGAERVPRRHERGEGEPPTDKMIDDSIEATFPASDPPARSSGPTL
jgi:hypothetical protein